MSQENKEKFLELKKKAGSHSPSLITLKDNIPGLEIKVDACFLSNPYATDLFIDYFKKEVVDTGEIRDLLEFYPSQNQMISNLLSEHLGVESEKVFVGNGAIEIIQAFMHRFVQKKIAVIIPTFSSYYEFVDGVAETVFFKLSPEEDFKLDVEKYIKFVNKERPDTIVIINPNNPNGCYLTQDELEHIFSELSWVNNIIIDESFIHFAFEDDELSPVSSVPYLDKYSNITVIKSMSKDFGVAGIRAGYAVMQPEKVKELLKNGFLWNSNGLAEYFFRLYTRTDFLEEYDVVRRRYILETQDFIKRFSHLEGVKVFPSRANFMLASFETEVSVDKVVADMLCDYNIYLRTCSDKIGLESGNYVRIASRTLKENSYMINAFKDYL